MKNKETKKKITDDLWKYFREFIINRDTDELGNGKCISCPRVLNTERDKGECHAGHFDHGKQNENYYNPKNVHLQCRTCNYYGGVKTVQTYTLNMIRLYGEKETEQIKESKYHYWSYKELKELRDYYKFALYLS